MFWFQQNKLVQTGFTKGMERLLGVAEAAKRKEQDNEFLEDGLTGKSDRPDSDDRYDVEEADLQDEDEGNNRTRQRYQRLFWESVAEGEQPTVVLLREGTDSSQGNPQLLSNISACLAISQTLLSTLGPRGMDKLIVNERGDAQITNDGATILKLLDIVHPAARTLVDIARAQDAEVGDGTTSVVLLAAQLLKEVRGYIEEGVSPHIIMKGFRKASQLAAEHVKAIQISLIDFPTFFPGHFRSLLLKIASTSMSSKLIHSEKPFFSKMVVDAVQCLDQDDLDESLIGVKKIPGGGMQDSNQNPFKNPLILSLNVELELKAEKDNAEVRVEAVSDYQAIVDAEWEIIYRKLEAIEKTGAKVVLSKLPIGDLATQWFADRDIFCAGRVPAGDLRRVCQAVGGSIQSTCSDMTRDDLGACGSFEEIQIGGERYNIFKECPKAKTCTLILRGGAEQFIEEVERSLHDAIMVVKRAIRNGDVVAGGGAVEMDVSAHIRKHALSIPGKQQLIMAAFAKALEIIPRQICDNAGLDSTDILNKLRMRHAAGDRWCGVDVDGADGVRDNMEAFVWEPPLVKLNAFSSATEAACLILSVDETVRNPQSEAQNSGPRAPPGTAQRALRGRGRGIPRR
ncbi:TCP-1/cpn60 chaperonin family-domain-containing protein [Boletus edulis]|nr:TCP-1/cpn60 chaperonin family-domain-containing protein [Boletus edulis]